MKFLILGVNGMLGHSIFSYLKQKNEDVHGLMRASSEIKELNFFRENIHFIESIHNNHSADLIFKINPDYIINCVGVIKQNILSHDKHQSLLTNAILPHELARIASDISATLIHFSTDCIFSGSKGNYLDNDHPDCSDVYGMSKFLGEVDHKTHLTFRTSMIGHELNTKSSLLEWFLSQEDSVEGYTQAIFSGFPTCVIAEILYKKIIGNPIPGGIYNLAADPIDKFTLLSKIANTYGKKISILPKQTPRIDRSLIGNKLQKLIDYQPPSWDELVEFMYLDFKNNPIYDFKQ